MANNLNFNAWQRSQLFLQAQEAGPRLKGQINLKMVDTIRKKDAPDAQQEAHDTTSFTLMSPADIVGLKPCAFKHMAPAPFIRDAETTKFVHIDLWEADLPWRYTPRANADNTLRPWMVLLVGTTAEIQVDGGAANVSDSVLSDHVLANSHLWAHTQDDGSKNADGSPKIISRILSPRELPPKSACVAVLVPAFNEDGDDMWQPAGDGVLRKFGKKGFLPALHSWQFMTEEAGDFKTLAEALKVPPAGNVGKAKLHYRRKIEADDVDVDATLEVRGAITSQQQEETLQPEEIKLVFDDVELLSAVVPNAIGLPRYGRPWLPNPDDFADGWPATLHTDPRFRGIAGLGLWMGVEAQEDLMDAAVKQAGALREAGQRIGYLALGLLASGRLWDRHMPVDKKERLRILGPMMARMLTNGGFVLDKVTSGTSPLVPALFSSAAQRILRDRSAHTRHVQGANGGFNRSDALSAANQPPPLPDPAPNGLPHFDALAHDLGLSTLEDLLRLDSKWIEGVVEQLDEITGLWIKRYREKRDQLIESGQEDQVPLLRKAVALDKLIVELADRLSGLLQELHLPCEAKPILDQFPGGYEPVLDDDTARPQLAAYLRRALRACMTKSTCDHALDPIDPNDPLHHLDRSAFCQHILDILPPSQLSPAQKPFNLDGLSDLIFGALDPRKEDAPARVRVCSQIQGIDCSRLIPPEYPIGLDFPTWTLLKKYDTEWLLPGASNLQKDSVTALQTNPAFIDAFMLGINTQFMSEMRWRDLAVERTCTPLRMFWGQVNYARHERQADIQPLAEWAKAPAEPIGALSHQSIKPHDDSNTSGSRLVIAFRSDLFRRYPSTLVYLVKPSADEAADTIKLNKLLGDPPELDMPDAVAEADTEQWRSSRKYFGPIFAGTITPELTFFAFDVTPEVLDQYWLVLDEPPAELRFRFDKLPAAVKTNSATFAGTTIDRPTRVAISGKDLKEQGLHE